MLRRPRHRAALAVLTVLWTVLLGASGALLAPAATAQQLVDVEPGNGDSVRETPRDVVLTFAEPLDDATVTVTLRTPSGEDEATARVDGRSLTVPVRDVGPGLYEVNYVVTPGEARGSTGFTVLAEGQEAAETSGTSTWLLIGGSLLIAGFAIAVLRTVSSWRNR